MADTGGPFGCSSNYYFEDWLSPCQTHEEKLCFCINAYILLLW